MRAEDANQIIAEFMGCEPFIEMADGQKLFTSYTSSLDALVPVWEKLDIRLHTIGAIYEERREELGANWAVGLIGYRSHPNVSANGMTIQEAAAIATAKAIREVSGGTN